MKPYIRRYARISISLLLGFLLLWLITRGQDIEQIMGEFRQARYGWVFLAMGCAILSHFVRALRWNMLIGSMGYQTKTLQTFYAVMTGYLANLAIPRMGEITRCITLGKASKTPFSVLAGTVLAERVFDLLSIMAILFFTIVLQFGFLRSFLRRVFLVPLIEKSSAHWLPFMIVALALLFMGGALFFYLRKKARRSSEGEFFYKMKRQYRGFLNGFKTIMTMRGKGWFAAYTFVIWGLYYMTLYLCFFAIGATAHLGLLSALTLLAVGSLGILAPVPGGIGTYHFLTIITLTELYGISSEPATSYAYITHATQIVVNIVAGTASWFILSMKKKRPEGKSAGEPAGTR